MQKLTRNDLKTHSVNTCMLRETCQHTAVWGIRVFNQKRKTALILTLASFLLCLCQNIRAQSSEEMRMLELFYGEKDLVITPTRYPKPVNQVAENISVIYSEDIEAMNAHTVADVLRWIPGVFINSSRDFGAISLLGIQGSEDRHVTVLLDGIRWNYLGGGNAETNTIPVGIIDRIEVIKGPASSAWGSSLGGVINIITKPAVGKEFKGQLYGSYGEANSLDARAEASGGGENFGYYLFAGRQESNGLLDNRSMDNVSLFSKFNMDLTNRTGLNLSLGYSEPENDLGSFPSNDIRSNSEARTVYANASLDVDLTARTSLNFTGYYISQDLNLDSSALGLGATGPAGALYLNSDYQEETYGATANLVWEPPRHTVVMGAEISQGDLDQTIHAGDLFQFYGAPAMAESHPDIMSWGVYINDTFSLGRWAMTPGIRFDRNTVSGSFFSPSLGVTFQPRNDLLFRGTVSRGFQSPPLAFSEGGAIFLDPNPDLKAEEVWSYQAGIETTALPGVRVKTTLFLHELDRALFREPYGSGAPSYNDLFINSGGLQRRGVEVELKTEPVKNVSLEASGIYVRFDQDNSVGSNESYAFNLILSYDNPDILTARLAGHFRDLNSMALLQANFDDIIWDFDASKTLAIGMETVLKFFLTAHNLFDGSQYNLGDTKNPGRWLEGGIRFAF